MVLAAQTTRGRAVKERPVYDCSALPTWGFATRSTPFWGTLAYIAIEGSGFALAVGAYLYLAVVSPRWPLTDVYLEPRPGAALAVLLVASLVPNWWLNRMALRQDLRAVRQGLVIMSLVGCAAIAVRAFEFAFLGIRWNADAYGSIVWLILGLHTAHLVTDVGDTIVLTALMFTRHAQPRRFSDVTDNAFYWVFVVVTWPPLFGLIYWPSLCGAGRCV
jgi:heme/copper-type cytochrome/quinol oxidase subunit 3